MDKFVEHLGTLGLDPEDVFPPVTEDGNRHRPENLPPWPDEEIDETEVRLLDSQGFVIKRGLLSPEQVTTALSRIRAYTDNSASAHKMYKFPFMELHPLFFHMMEHSWIMKMCARFVGSIFRLDHTFGVDTPAGSTQKDLHGGPLSGFGHNLYVAGLPLGQDIARVGLLNVQISLTGSHKNLGGFCCIPGSHTTSDHKVRNRQGDATYCDTWNELEAAGSIVVPECDAGDCVIFFESLVHGTYPSAQHRTSLYYKYSSGTSCFRPPTEIAHYPHYAFTKQQRALLAAPGAIAHNSARYEYLPGYLSWKPDSILPMGKGGKRGWA